MGQLIFNLYGHTVNKKIIIDFDSIIYSLQNYGGASVYWKNIVDRISSDPTFCVKERNTNRRLRGIPAISQADVFHSSHFRICVTKRVKKVSTVHDLTYELGHIKPTIGSRINILERRASYFNADALVCISENTRRDLLSVYPELSGRVPIHVIHHGFTLSIAERGNSVGHIDEPYYLFVGARDGYKNFMNFIKAYYQSRLFSEGIKIVCTGSKFNDFEKYEISKLGISSSVFATGKIGTSALYSLYRNAIALVYVSKYEGFGLPLLEAMNNRCPVIASNISSIPEIASDAALLVNPDDVGSISKALIDMTSAKLREYYRCRGEERAKFFSWEKSAELHKELYKEIVN